MIDKQNIKEIDGNAISIQKNQKEENIKQQENGWKYR